MLRGSELDGELYIKLDFWEIFADIFILQYAEYQGGGNPEYD